ncbi:MAG: hypothetical protein DMG96_34835 [Acidobacteria bacterium]|nr:MAG: hypothetical protein DMG96_34835 [Acidobacteriota bacterium]
MKTVGRNAACPCGSGKKYKRCCGVQTVESSPPRAIPSVYQPIAAHGYAPWQIGEMIRFAEQTLRAQ